MKPPRAAAASKLFCPNLQQQNQSKNHCISRVSACSDSPTSSASIGLLSQLTLVSSPVLSSPLFFHAQSPRLRFFSENERNFRISPSATRHKTAHQQTCERAPSLSPAKKNASMFALMYSRDRVYFLEACHSLSACDESGRSPADADRTLGHP